MTTPPALFHAFLRPAILQILRATGYHSTKPAVLDSLTDLAARYMMLLCENTAKHASHNHGDNADFSVVDVRQALEDAGALLPSRCTAEEEWRGDDDIADIEEFIAWFSSQRMKELMEFGNSEGDTEATDYLNALKTKHNKTGDDAKFHGTILGRPAEGTEVFVEGGSVATVKEWVAARTPRAEGDVSSPASSGLSSVGDLPSDDEMDLTMAA